MFPGGRSLPEDRTRGETLGDRIGRRHTTVCRELSFSLLGDGVNWLKLAARRALGTPPSPGRTGVGPDGSVLKRPGRCEPWLGWSVWRPGWRLLSLEKRLWMSWNFSFSSRRKTSTRSFFSRLNCSTMVLGTSGIPQATMRLRNITRFWREGEREEENGLSEREKGDEWV
ncbi:hypothetical protein EYF80_047265 [Liparis tanakae]|uniref:Uncharacterized protein n=1 Tax=Liparis tanakae TaxID=230148 RepID=A0A4Z2FNX5_9TELE|nr:hypothetical protein EYF80_047265 [Liparis tanakae]